MLAAVTGLAYFMANIIKVEGYIGYVLPLPSVIAAMRWGAPTGWRTVLATCFLISGWCPRMLIQQRQQHAFACMPVD